MPDALSAPAAESGIDLLLETGARYPINPKEGIANPLNQCRSPRRRLTAAS